MTLVIPTELEEQEPYRLLRDEPVSRRHIRHDDVTRDEPDLRQLLFGHLTGRVSRSHVADLVPKHRYQLRFGIEMGHDSARYVDESTRQCERIDDRIIDHAERPRQVGAL